ncbi:hypothetical protein [Sinorhizobium medicae]
MTILSTDTFTYSYSGETVTISVDSYSTEWTAQQQVAMYETWLKLPQGEGNDFDFKARLNEMITDSGSVSATFAISHPSYGESMYTDALDLGNISLDNIKERVNFSEANNGGDPFFSSIDRHSAHEFRHFWQTNVDETRFDPAATTAQKEQDARQFENSFAKLVDGTTDSNGVISAPPTYVPTSEWDDALVPLSAAPNYGIQSYASATIALWASQQNPQAGGAAC